MCLTGWSLEWLTGWSLEWLTGWSLEWLTGRLLKPLNSGFQVGWKVDWW